MSDFVYGGRSISKEMEKLATNVRAWRDRVEKEVREDRCFDDDLCEIINDETVKKDPEGKGRKDSTFYHRDR